MISQPFQGRTTPAELPTRLCPALRRRRLSCSVLVSIALASTFLFASSVPALGATNGCSREMQQLRSNIKRPGAGTRGLTRATVIRSLAACSTPAQWRTQANRFRIAAAIAPLLFAKNLETDRALDRLCTVFDAYQSTNVCKQHLTR